MAKENEDNKIKYGKKLLISVTIALFLINVWKFLNCPGSEIPIISLLFNLIIYLGIIIIIFHKNEINLDDYFKYDENKDINEDKSK